MTTSPAKVSACFRTLGPDSRMRRGPNGANSYGREVPLAPSTMPVATSDYDPVQARAMTKRDLRDLRRFSAISIQLI